MTAYADAIAKPPRTLTELEQRLLLKTTGEHRDGFRDHVLISGPDQAAADLMSAVAPRSGQYVFLVKQMLTEETDAPSGLEDEARGRVISPRELTSYLLGLLESVGHSPRAIRRAIEGLYGPRHRRR